MDIKSHQMTLLPPAKNVCQTCATAHPANAPHNKDSLYYQVAFNMQHNRAATWRDAMAHCDDETKRIWTADLLKRGVKVA